MCYRVIFQLTLQYYKRLNILPTHCVAMSLCFYNCAIMNIISCQILALVFGKSLCYQMLPIHCTVITHRQYCILLYTKTHFVLASARAKKKKKKKTDAIIVTSFVEQKSGWPHPFSSCERDRERSGMFALYTQYFELLGKKKKGRRSNLRFACSYIAMYLCCACALSLPV